MNSLVTSGIRILITAALASGGSWAVAFYTADYVSKAYLGGLTTAVEDLRASITDLGEAVRSVDSELRADVRSLNDARNDLATAVAEKVAAIQEKQQYNEKDIAEIKVMVARIEERLDNFPKASSISYDEAAKNFTVEGFDAVYKALGVDPKQAVFIGPIKAKAQ